ncbi:hypothetical protein Tco_1209840 [Tanacetum coccineum]
MASMKYYDKHNQVGFLKKPEESAGFAEIVYFLKGSHIRYAMTHNPTIHDSLVKQFWQTATASTLADGTLELRATINTLEYTITEASVRSKLQLADASGISMLPNSEIFEGMGNMGYPTRGSFTFWKSFFTPQWRLLIAQNAGQADQAGTQSQPSSSIVPPPPTSQPAPTESTTIPPTPVTKPTSKPSSPSTVPEHQPSSPRQESDIPQTQAPTHTHEAETRHMSVDDLFQLTWSKEETGSNDVSNSFEDVSTGFTDIKSASEKVSSGGEHASLAEIARIQAEEEAENARREELKRQDELAAKRLQEELELSEAQKKRMAQVQEAAQFYTEEDWDTIRAKLEANADLVKEIAGEDVSEADYAQRMVGLISQRRKLIAEQKAKAQRDKPMTQAQQRQYMATYLKNQGGWNLAQIKKLTDEELKEKFEYLMRSMERIFQEAKSDTREDVFVPKEKDKESVKREEEFEIKKSVLRYTKRKSLARKGLQKKPESAKSGTEEDVEAYMEERVDEPSSEEFPMGSIPQGLAPAKIFQGLLNDLTRDDIKELYRLMMLKYGDNRPEKEYERVLWGDLKTMFDPPSIEDAVWSLTHQQKVLSWRYFHSCAVYCLTLKAAHIYILTEVKYPLPSRVCQAMLEMKLIGDRKDEVCYQLLKLIEKQAQQQ